MDGHRGQQQTREREERQESYHARVGRGDLRADGAHQHVEEQRSPASISYAPSLTHTPPAFRWLTSIFLGREAVSTRKRAAGLLPLAADQRA